MQQPSTKAIEKARWVWECSEPEFTSRDTWLTDSTRRAVAAAYAIDVAPLEREISRLAAALSESQRELDNVLAVSGMDALLSERDALRAQREALIEALRAIAEPDELLDANEGAFNAHAARRMQAQARAVLAQGEEPPEPTHGLGAVAGDLTP